MVMVVGGGVCVWGRGGICTMAAEEMKFKVIHLISKEVKNTHQTG